MTNDTNGLHDLPEGWAWATIGNLVGDDGIFIDGDWVESKDQDPNGDVRLIQLADVGDGVYRNRSDRYLTSAKAAELGCTFLKAGDVLIARMPDPLGRACIFPGDSKPSVTVVDVCIVRTGSTNVDHHWLMNFINAPAFRAEIASLQSGSTRKRISRSNLAKLELPVPPIPEQQRIVTEIEKQFTRLDAGIAALKRAQANLKRYKAAVLKAACEGKLVEQDASDEPASELLARILAERQISKVRGRGDSRIAPTDDLPELPKGWCWATTEQLSYFVTDGDHNPPKRTPSGVPHLTAKNVFDWKLSEDDCTFISFDDFERTSKRYMPSGGDVIITCVGTLGRTAVVPDGYVFSADRNLAAIRLARDGLIPKLLQIYLNTPQVQDVLAKASGSTAQPHLYLGDLRALPVVLPPLAEQRRIVAEVERRLSVVQELDATLAANLARAERLRQSILKRAFEGRLV